VESDAVHGTVAISMKLTPRISLSFDGHCEAAFKLYEKCMNGTITFMLTWGDSPMAAQAPPGWGTKINHATLNVGDTAISGSDALPGQYEPPQGFSIILQMEDADAAERVFQALAEHGTVGMPLQKTFWARRFGSVVDQFGIPWAINCE
jgi:PhnB protein